MKSIILWSLASCISSLALAGVPDAAPGLTADQIVEKNIAARGGLEAWRKIQTMAWAGHIESKQAPEPSMPFVMELKRPNKTHFEINSKNLKSVRMYDGTQGWKLRLAANGKPELQPYTNEELSFARDGQGIDGQLMDYQAKGIMVALDGVDEVEGHKAYRLSIKLPSGDSHHVWIDAQTFLDIKYDHPSRKVTGQPGTVSVFYRNFKTFDGLQLPLIIESGADAKTTDKMVIDKISLNPPLEDQMFAKPGMPGRRNAVLIDTTSQAGSQAARPTPPMSTGFSRLNDRSAPDSKLAE